MAIMDKDIYLFLSARIKQERLKSGLTIERLAENAGISPSFLACILINKRKPSLDTIAKLAQALNIPLPKLFEGASFESVDTNENLKNQIFHMIASVKPAHGKILLATMRELSKNLSKNP